MSWVQVLSDCTVTQVAACEGMTTLALAGTLLDSCTKFTVDPGTNPVPVTVSVAPPAMELVVGEIEETCGTVGFHCQLFCVMVWPQRPVTLQGTGVGAGATTGVV